MGRGGRRIGLGQAALYFPLFLIFFLNRHAELPAINLLATAASNNAASDIE